MLELLVDIRLKDKLRDCAYVNQFCIETRYPSDSYIPVSEKEAQDCIDAARELLELLAGIKFNRAIAKQRKIRYSIFSLTLWQVEE